MSMTDPIADFLSRIRNGIMARHADYWRQQAYPVWLVIRTTDERSGSSIRWMDLSVYLERESRRRKTPVKQVEFRGEPLTAPSTLRLDVRSLEAAQYVPCKNMLLAKRKAPK